MLKQALTRLILPKNILQSQQLGFSTKKLFEVIDSPNAPKALGPYSQGIKVSPKAHLIYCSGLIGMDAKTGQLVSDDVVGQTTQALKNAEGILQEASSSFDQVVKSTVYLTDMKDYGAFNEEYAKFFKGTYPARVCIAVKQLPKDAKVEIDLIAVSDK